MRRPQRRGRRALRGPPAARVPGRPLALLAGPDVADVQVARRRPLPHAAGPDAPARGQRLLGPLAGRAGAAAPVARTLVGPAAHRSNLLLVSTPTA